MRIKHVIMALSVAGMVGALATGLNVKSSVKQADAFIEEDVAWDYLAVDGNNFKISGDLNPNDWVTGRSGTFWDYRSFNALDNFYDGFHNEGWTGTLTSASWKQTKRYVTFTLGGNNGENSESFVEIRKKSDDTLVKKIENTYFNDPNLSLNMLLRVVDLNEVIGQSLYLKITDGLTGGFAGVTFGALKVSQSEEDVARSISVYKNNLSKRTHETAAWNDSLARTYILNIMSNNTEWTDFDSVVLTDGDAYFEDYNQCTNLALDTDSVSGFGVNAAGYDGINWSYGEAYNLADTWDWDERMPFNKEGSAFFKGNYGGDSAKYTLLTNDFKFSGEGYFSIKLAGNGTKVALLDADTGAELVSATNTNYKDGDKWNVFANKTYTCTMTRYIIDAREHLNKTVRVAISDNSTEGWSILMFDELKTKYDTLPTFALDSLSQTPKDQATRYGVIPSILVQTTNDDMKKAYDFLQNYYSVFREEGSFKYLDCAGFTSDELQDLCDDYNDLSSDAKAILATANDYDRGSVSGDYFFLPVNTSNNVNDVVSSIITNNGLTPSGDPSPANNGLLATANATTLVIVASASILTLMGLAFLFFKKRKQEN